MIVKSISLQTGLNGTERVVQFPTNTALFIDANGLN